MVWLCLFRNTPWPWPTPAKGSNCKSRIPFPAGAGVLCPVCTSEARKIKVALAGARVSHTLSRPGFRIRTR